MNRINTHNYEAYLLDYLEGNLNQEDIKALMLFLDKNPDLKLEVQDMELSTLPKENIQLPLNPETLKKTINKDTVEEYIILSIEGQLTEEDQAELDEFIANQPDLKALYKRYKKSKLPIKAIAYPNKERLKKRTPIIFLYPALGAVAAAIILLLLFYSTNEPNNKAEKASKTLFTLKNISKTPVKPGLQVNSNIGIEDSEVGSTKKIEKDSNTLKGPFKNKNAHASLDQKVNATSTVLDRQNNPGRMKNGKGKDSSSTLLAKHQDLKKVDILKQGELRAPETEERNRNARMATIEIDSTTRETVAIQNNASQNENEALTLGQWATKVFRNKILKKESPDNEKLKVKEVVSSLAEKADKKSHSDLAFQEENNDNSFSWKFSIWRIEIERIKTQ
jgi:hypothetical protein